MPLDRGGDLLFIDKIINAFSDVFGEDFFVLRSKWYLNIWVGLGLFINIVLWDMI